MSNSPPDHEPHNSAPPLGAEDLEADLEVEDLEADLEADLEGPSTDDLEHLPPLTFPEQQRATLVINADEHETRVAYLLDGVPSELFFTRRQDASLVGNIYKGRVVRVLPGMQAAFVDIGLKQAAFLYIDDISPINIEPGYTSVDHSTYNQTVDVEIGRTIQQLIQEGQELMVQVSKDPISTKGARVTSQISIPGRHLVYIPTADTIGVSRRITDEEERARLKELLEELVPKGGGFVARTAAEGCSLEDLREDLNFLQQVWNDVLTRMESHTAPHTLYEDLDLPLKATRDLVKPNLDEVVVDHPDTFERLQRFMGRFMPQYAARLRLHEDPEPIFETYGVEAELNRALSRKVWLPSGGYLIIDQTEALTSIDVNSGRFVGKYHFEETIYRTNIEAVHEVVHQLMLRNLGGIIIIDLIDMERASMRDRVYTAFLDALKRDPAKTHASKISGLGLIEMTRKRVRDSLLRSFCDPCLYCQGTGFLKSPQTITHQIYRELISEGWALTGEQITLEVHPLVAQCFEEVSARLLSDLEERLGRTIRLFGDDSLHLERYRYRSS